MAKFWQKWPKKAKNGQISAFFCGYCCKDTDHEYFAHCPECMELECADPDECVEAIDNSNEALFKLHETE